jgi:hypothetical protein
LCVVSNWIIRVYTILVWNTISGSSNIDICCYHCLILTLIFHLKVLINFFFFIIFIIIIINSIIGIIIMTTTTSSITIIVVVVVTIVVVLLLFIIYIINLPVVRPRSCWVIYYFDTPALGRRHQFSGRVRSNSAWLKFFWFFLFVLNLNIFKKKLALFLYYGFTCRNHKWSQFY